MSRPAEAICHWSDILLWVWKNVRFGEVQTLNDFGELVGVY